MEGFAQIYSQMSDEELLELCREQADLVPEARKALLAELQTRSLPEPQEDSREEPSQPPLEEREDLLPEERIALLAELQVKSLSERQEDGGVEPDQPSLEVVFESIDAAGEGFFVRGLLESNGFEVIVKGFVPTLLGMRPGTQLLVPAERADEARRLIAESRGDAPGESSDEAGMDRAVRSPELEATGEVVFESADALEAQVAQQLLESKGFKVSIRAQVLVAAERAEEARRLIAESFAEVPERTATGVDLIGAAGLIAESFAEAPEAGASGSETPGQVDN
jgi:hypothetical protein